MRIVTWNVNSIKQRLEHLLTYLKEVQPDVVCLQEIKCTDEAFPRLELEAMGYNVATHGQKAFNGVALLSKTPLEDLRRGLPGGEAADEQARYLEGVASTGSGVIRLASIYFPNGNPIASPKFGYKLAWMDCFKAHALDLLALEEPMVLAGDYNVIPEPRDARYPDNWVTDALYQPDTRAKYREILHIGLNDAIRACTDGGDLYTFWDYQAGGWQKNNGIRIDHMLLSPQATDRLIGAEIHKKTRGWDKPSDHVPVLIELGL